jgi:4-hydroxybenzoate polyprenyltransferase/geranylgeranylglycerol-phosphate geranylgeranyltransferase
MAAGWLMAAPPSDRAPHSFFVWPFFVGLFLLVSAFFIQYTYRFPYHNRDRFPYFSSNTDKLSHRAIRDIIAGALIVLGSLLTLPLLAQSYDPIKLWSPDGRPFLAQLTIALTYLVTVLVWAGQLRKDARDARRGRILDWLTIPALFSIGLGVCSGYVLRSEALINSLWGPAAIAAYLAYFLLAAVVGTRKTPTESSLRTLLLKSPFSVFNCLVLATGSALFFATLFQPTLSQVNLTLAIRLVVGAVPLSAFIAVVEACRITAFEFENRNSSKGSICTFSYYKSTTLAIAACILILPIMILTLDQYHFLFYILVGALVLSFYFFWLMMGINNRFRGAKCWALIKLSLGFGILAVIFSDSWTQWPISIGGWLTQPWLSSLLSYPTLSIYALALFYLAGSLMRDYDRYKMASLNSGQRPDTPRAARRRILRRMSDDPRNAGRILGILSFAPFLVLFLIDFGAGCTVPPEYECLPGANPLVRAAEMLYLLICCVCLLFNYSQGTLDFRIDTDFKIALSNPSPEPPTTDGGEDSTQFMGLLRLLRLPTGLFVLMIVAISYGVTGSGWTTGLILGMPFALAAMLGFALNDISDCHKDAVSKPRRPIPSGQVSLGAARTAALVVGVLAFGWATWVPLTGWHRSFYFVAFVGVILYNGVVRYAALAKTPIAALLSVSPLAFCLLTLEPGPLPAVVSGLAFLYITGRELRMDALDVDGDLQGRTRTFPILFGVSATTRVAFALIVGSMSVLSLLVLKFEFGPVALVLISLLWLGQLLCEVLWGSGMPTRRRTSIRLQWIPMLAGSFAVLMA